MRDKYIYLVRNQIYIVIISNSEKHDIIYYASTVLKEMHIVR